MKITSWNVNGIRAILEKWFFQWLEKDSPDILCLQETKAFEHQLPADFRYMMKDYNYVWHAGQKPWYAGVATFYKKTLSLISSKSRFESIEHFHEDGRVVETVFDKFVLLNVYFPNWWEKADGTEMLSYKLAFYDKMTDYIDRIVVSWKHVVVCGDFNICHKEIDIARPKENENSIWFLPVERAKMDELENHWYVDMFRSFHPELKDQYTWRSYRAGARPRNVGWRLDYFWVDKNLVPHIKNMIHQTAVQGSDHCPISLEINL